MRKNVYGKQLNRSRKSREALFRSLSRALVIEGSIITTKAKAKAIRGSIDRLVTLAKNESLASRRRLYSALANDRETTDRLIEIAKTKLTSRISGYTRSIPQPIRRGDGAETVRLEWVLDPVRKTKKESERARVSKKKTKKK